MLNATKFTAHARYHVICA